MTVGALVAPLPGEGLTSQLAGLSASWPLGAWKMSENEASLDRESFFEANDKFCDSRVFALTSHLNAHVQAVWSSNPQVHVERACAAGTVRSRFLVYGVVLVLPTKTHV